MTGESDLPPGLATRADELLHMRPKAGQLAGMATEAFGASGLDHETLVLVWLAALVALDAPIESYLMNVGAAARPRLASSECTRCSRHSPRSSGPPGLSLRPPESWSCSSPAHDPVRPSPPLEQSALFGQTADRPASARPRELRWIVDTLAGEQGFGGLGQLRPCRLASARMPIRGRGHDWRRIVVVDSSGSAKALATARYTLRLKIKPT
jgi:hypothetical protein